jgi:hypothetical protein
MSHKDRPNFREILNGVEQSGSVASYARVINKPRKTVSDWYTAAKQELASIVTNQNNGEFSTKTYIVTSAQIGTEVHQGFMDNLEAMAKHHDAEILIPGITYNVNSEWEGGLGDAEKKVKSQYYDARVRPYLMNVRFQLNEKVVVLGNLNILPTAANPLTGYSTFTGESSAILPHPKISLESVATRPSKLAKMLVTTGACTVPNYIQKNAGIKGDFHHQLGAVIVEIVNNKQFHMRHVIGEEDGTFFDLTDKYSRGHVSVRNRVDYNVWGDIHHIDLDPKVAEANWGEGSLSDLLKPRHQVFHDLLDFKVRNHHNRDNPLFMQRMANESVLNEVTKAALFMWEASTKDCTNVVVRSNHDDAFDRWVNEVSHFDEPNIDNALFLLHCQAEKYKMLKEGKTKDMFATVASAVLGKSDAKFLKRDESYVVNGVENGMHGDVGLNGARATPKSFTKIGIKCNTGHTHSAAINEGVYTAGCCRTLNADYTKGPSSWSHTQIIQYPNGKRTLLTCINGQYYKKRFKKARV